MVAWFDVRLDRHVHDTSSMNFFYLSPDDRDWLKRWLVKHAFLLLLILSFWLILHAWPKAETPASNLDGRTDNQPSMNASGNSNTLGDASQDLHQGQAMAWVEDGPQAIRLVELKRNSANATAYDAFGANSSMNQPSADNSVSAVQPTGWRRTRNGWENTASWRTSLASLGDIVRQQQEKEPSWFQNLLASVRSVPPWGVALFQLAAVGGILIFERWAVRHQQTRKIKPEA